MSNKIAILTGGTGGHIFPAQAIAQQLVSRGFGVTILANKNYQKFHSSSAYNFKIIKASYIKKDLSLILFPIVLFYGFMQSFFWFLKNKPQKIISFGSYATFPSLAAAVICGIKFTLHEQNSILGKVNKIFIKFASKVALSYPKTMGIKQIYCDKIIYTGNPVRHEIELLRNNNFTLPYFLKKNNNINDKFFNKDCHNFNILILGGSGGASIFGTKIVDAMNFLANEGLNINITHQTHKYNMQEVKNSYRNYKIKAHISDFFVNIADEISKSHLIISRAGSSAIAEFICAKKPVILVPFAKSTNNHQFFNATALSSKDCAIIIEEKDFNALNLVKSIENIINNPKIMVDMVNNIEKLDFISSKDISNKLY